MRNLIAPAALIVSLALGSAAFAATPPASTAPAKPAATAMKTDAHAKRAACEKAWKAEKSHTGTEQAFVKACVAKG